MNFGIGTEDNQNKGKVLIVSFSFPPTNNIAAVRVGKLAKYLPSFGWEPIVLTADKGKELPQTLPLEIGKANVIRTTYFALGPALFYGLTGYERAAGQPSSQSSKWIQLLRRIARFAEPIYTLPLLRLLALEPLGWYRPALSMGLEIMSKHKVDVIFSSYGPAMSHVIASRLHRETGVPWVADFRDLWSLNPYLRKVQPFHFFEQKIEKKVMGDSDLLITVSEPMTGQLKTLHGKKVITIHNGFDDEDYREEVPLTRKFTITYTGNIYPKKRDPTTLFKALAELMAEGKIASSDLEVRFFGGNTLAALLPIVEACHVGEFVKIYGFVPFKESVRRQKESTVLLLLLWTDVGEKGIYTGKFFEYLGARRPILAIGPRYGVVDKLLKESGAGIVVNKVKEIKAILSEWIEEFEHSGTIRSNYKPDSAVLYQFMRRKQAEKLAHILDKVTKQQDVKMV
jgi:hypothetical protein